MMDTIKPYVRIVLGLVFLVFGLNGFFNFLPMQMDLPEAAVKFTTALAETGYMFKFIKGTEVLCGALLLAGIFVPLALAMITPIILNIVAFHYFLAPQGLIVSLIILFIHMICCHGYRVHFKSVLQPT